MSSARKNNNLWNDTEDRDYQVPFRDSVVSTDVHDDSTSASAVQASDSNVDESPNRPHFLNSLRNYSLNNSLSKVNEIRERIKGSWNQYMEFVKQSHKCDLLPQGEPDAMSIGRYLYWGDIITLFVDFFQVLGLYWITANPWPIPYPWVSWTSWYCVFNLDAFSLYENGAIYTQSTNYNISKWGTLPNYCNEHVLPFILVMGLFYSSLNFLNKYVFHKWGSALRQERQSEEDIFENKQKEKPVSLEGLQNPYYAFYIFMFYILYVPIGIVSLRVFYCERITDIHSDEYDTMRLAADYDMECWTGLHMFYVVFTTLTYIPLLIWLPFYIHSKIRTNVVYSHAGDHEKRLQAWEISCFLNLDEHFLDTQAWLTAGATRNAAYFKIWMLLYKATLLINYIAVRSTFPYNKGSNNLKELQSLIFWVTTTLFLSRWIIFPQWGARIGKVASEISSIAVNLILKMLDRPFVHKDGPTSSASKLADIWLNHQASPASSFIQNATRGYHNGPYRSHITNWIFYILSGILYTNACMGVCNALGVVNVITINSNQTLLMMITHYGGFILLGYTLVSTLNNPFALWPSITTIHRIQENKPFKKLARKWIRVLCRCSYVRQHVLRTPSEVIDVKSFRDLMKSLRSAYLEARNKGSIFELILNEKLEELLVLYGQRQTNLARKNENWDQAYREAIEHQTFAKREASTRLMPPKKRRILLKLLALKMLQERDSEASPDLLAMVENDSFTKAMRDIDALDRSTVIFLEKLRRITQSLQNENNVGKSTRSGKSTRMSSSKDSIVFADPAIGTMGEIDSFKDVDRLIGGFQLSISNEEDLRNDAKRLELIEEFLFKWEQILSSLQEDLDAGDEFARKLFSQNKLETWFGYRDILVKALMDHSLEQNDFQGILTDDFGTNTYH